MIANVGQRVAWSHGKGGTLSTVTFLMSDPSLELYCKPCPIMSQHVVGGERGSKPIFHE